MDLMNQTEDLKIEVGWKWRARGGPIDPKDMAPTHLWYTLRMIWNHHVPHEKRFKKYKAYSFNPKTHGPDYMKSAIKHLFIELSGRSDLPDHLVNEFNWMMSHFLEVIRQREVTKRAYFGSLPVKDDPVIVELMEVSSD